MKILQIKDYGDSKEFLVEVEPHLIAKIFIIDSVYQSIIKNSPKNNLLGTNYNPFRHHLSKQWFTLFCKVGHIFHAVDMKGWTLKDDLDASGKSILSNVLRYCVENY